MEATGQTIRQWLEQVAGSDTSTERDSIKMGNLLRKVGFPKANVVLGIVYIEGRGTPEYPPMALQQIAKVLLQANQ